MKIGTNRTKKKIYLYWESDYERVHVTAFARKHGLNLTIHDKKHCLALDIPGQRIHLHDFLFSTTEPATARQVFDDIIRRMQGEDRPERSYGLN